VIIRALVLVALLLVAGAFGTLAQSAVAAGDPALGQFLAGQCVQCHRADGQARPGIPPIIGWPQDAFVAVLASYKKRERPNAVMQSVADSLSDEDMAALAAYYGALKPAR
jgi:cytochrome c553